ncbi:sialic acid synthase [Thermoplasmatales archaeon SCGC AB-540-F20]|nr:sialic acid synthase [Thermoplasmatales archaeon SCGC AB-540-F20]
MNPKNFKGKHGPLLLAEIGGNHEGDFEYAKKLTKLAIESDVDYIKFQLYSADNIVNRVESPDKNKHFKKFELSKGQYIELAKMCLDNNAKFLASVWDESMLEWIDPYMSVYKIGSGDLTAYCLLKKIAGLKKPIILSTGLSKLNEVIDSVNYIQSLDKFYKNPDNLALLQCTSMYPITFEDANLNVMQKYFEKTGLTIGYSDHTIGSKALEVAFAMGANILEFHFTDTRKGKEFRDHKVSLTKPEVKRLISNIKDIKKLKGSSLKKPLEVEGNHRTTFRRGVYPIRDLKKGTILNESVLVCLRPNHGIDAREYFNLIGKKLLVDVKAYQKLEKELLEGID